MAHRTRRRIATVLSASVAGPGWLADGASMASLTGLHVVTAATVIVGMAGTLPVIGRRRAAHRRPAARLGDRPGEPRGTLGRQPPGR